MATVFRARDKELRRDVAVKVLFPHLARRPDIVRRFHREARAAAGLEHANILRIYDVGGAEGDDPPYIVMEMIRGRTLLEDIEQRGPMFSEIVACVGVLLADALAAAHKASIVHRDVKPANVLVAAGGRLLLADFGVARLETEDSLVTKTGALLGTPAYMSPEQAMGDTATAKSDLYSLGATLYQLATGMLPYTGGSAKVLAQIATGALVPPHKKRAAVGPDLSNVIVALMATAPEDRVASAVIASSELRAIAVAGGLGDPTEELAAYFTDAEAFIRERSPKIVAATIGAAHRASADGKLPRAMALADRAAALAPHDPAVTTLIETLAEGGRSRGRRKLLAITGLGLALAGGGTAVALGAFGDDDRRDAGTRVADASVAELGTADAGSTGSLLDAGAIAISVDASSPAPRDAAVVVSARDAGTPRSRLDASTAVALATDASITVDAASAVVAPPTDAALDSSLDASLGPVTATGAILVRNDTFCDVSIDGESKGLMYPATARPIRVPAGPHTVVCSQASNHKSWTQQVEVTAGETKVVTGSLLPAFDVAFATDVLVGGVLYKAGTATKLKGRHEIKKDGVVRWVTINGTCQVRDKPELDCYR
ncbi:MAG: serine/threonine protein kinase [Myxococcales bacterium]|nr:serine/threonine protein kinase [Myxococcales bacterium]